MHLCRDIPTLNKSLFEVGLGWLKDLVLYTASLLQFPVAFLRISTEGDLFTKILNSQWLNRQHKIPAVT